MKRKVFVGLDSWERDRCVLRRIGMLAWLAALLETLSFVWGLRQGLE